MVSALGFLIFWQIVGLYGQITATIVSHGIFFVTLPLVNIALGLASIDRAAVEAARTLGADERTVFRTIVLPSVRPYIISGYAFAFVLSLNEYIVAYMVAGSTVVTLPIKIFNALRYGYTPVMAAVTALFVLVVLSATSHVASAGFAGLAIGMALTVVHLIGIPLTGTSVNPARSLGPALIVGGDALNQVWLFILAPLVGGMLAGAAWLTLIAERPEPGAAGQVLESDIVVS